MERQSVWKNGSIEEQIEQISSFVLARVRPTPQITEEDISQQAAMFYLELLNGNVDSDHLAYCPTRVMKKVRVWMKQQKSYLNDEIAYGLICQNREELEVRSVLEGDLYGILEQIFRNILELGKRFDWISTTTEEFKKLCFDTYRMYYGMEPYDCGHNIYQISDLLDITPTAVSYRIHNVERWVRMYARNYINDFTNVKLWHILDSLDEFGLEFRSPTDYF